MTTSLDMLNYCRLKGIDVTFRPMPENGSVSFRYNRNYYIGVDDSDMTEAELKVHLAHEVGHCETDSFYNPYCPIDERSRHEYQSNKWAIKKLLPEEELQQAFEQGVVEVWQLAEHFDVNEDLVRFACEYYFMR